MKVLLADSHGPIFGKPQGTPNLGLLYLASYARERFPEAEFKYLPQGVSLEGHLSEIAEFEPDIYVLSFTSYGELNVHHDGRLKCVRAGRARSCGPVF